MLRITEESDGDFNRNTLPRKVERNARGTVIYRSDYELRGLRKIKTLTLAAMRDFGEAKTVMERIAAGRFVIECMERERILLRIPLPASAKAPEPRRVPGQVSYNDAGRSGPLVMEDAQPSAQPITSNGPDPSQSPKQ